MNLSPHAMQNADTLLTTMHVHAYFTYKSLVGKTNMKDESTVVHLPSYAPGTVQRDAAHTQSVQCQPCVTQLAVSK